MRVLHGARPNGSLAISRDLICHDLICRDRFVRVEVASVACQQTPIIKWRLGGMMCNVALSAGCARRVVEFCVSSTSAARGEQLVGKAGLIAGT